MNKLNKSISVLLVIIIITSTFSVVTGMSVPPECDYVCEYICENVCGCAGTGTDEEPDDPECDICQSPDCGCAKSSGEEEPNLEIQPEKSENFNLPPLSYLNDKGETIVLNNYQLITAGTTTITNGYWVVDGNISRGQIAVNTGNTAHLILKDGSHLQVTGANQNSGINVPEDSTLHIYAQSKGVNMGKLTAQGGTASAGIGGRGTLGAGNGGTIIINGGNIIATGGNYGAGIGGGEVLTGTGGPITINSGNIIATGGVYAAGIGGGTNGNGGTITINGGNITATAGLLSSAIGRGAPINVSSSVLSENVTVNGNNWLYLTSTTTTPPTTEPGGPGVFNWSHTFGYIRLQSTRTPTNIPAIQGITPPVSGVAPVTAITPSQHYTGTVTWSPSVSDTFATRTVYTATITLEDRGFYTPLGVPSNFFTVAGASSVSNAAGSRVVTAVFPATVAIPVSNASINKTNITLIPNFTERLTVSITPDNASNKNVIWNTSNPAVAAVNNDGLVRAVAPGNAVITAITEDGGRTVTCSVRVIAPALELNRSFVLLENGNNTTLTPTSNICAYYDILSNLRWESRNNNVATISSTGVVTAVGTGTTTVRVISDKYGLSAECRVEVIAVAPTAGAVTGVRLLQTGATINARSLSPLLIPKQLLFTNTVPNAATQSTGLMEVNGTGSQNIVQRVTLQEEFRSFFVVNVINDRFVEMTPTTALANHNIRSIPTTLTVELVDGKTHVTDVLTISVSRTVPTIRFATVRFNSFFPGDPVSVIATSNLGNITNIRLAGIEDGNMQENSFVTYDRVNRILRLKPGQNPGRLAFDVMVEGFGWVLNQNVSVSVSRTIPGARLSSSTVTKIKEAQLRVNSDRLIESVTLVPRSRNDVVYRDYAVQWLSEQPNGTFRLIYKPGTADNVTTNAKLRFEVRFAGEDAGSVFLNLSVRAQGNTSIRLSSSSVTLSTHALARGNNKIINIMPTPVDANLSIGFTREYIGDAERHITVNWSPGDRFATVLLKNDANTGTYRVEFKEGDRRVAVLTVRVVDKEPVIRLSARGVFNVADPGSTITLTPGFTNYNRNSDTGKITIKDAENSAFYIVPGSETPNGTVTLRMKEVDKDGKTIIKPTTRQNVTLVYDGIESVPIGITPRQVRPKLQFNNRILLLSRDAYCEDIVKIGIINPASATISGVEIDGKRNNELYTIRKVQDGSFAIGFNLDDKGQIDPRTGQGGNVRLNVSFQGSDNPVRITVRIVVS